MNGHTFRFDYGEHVEGATNCKVQFEVNRDASLTEMVEAFKLYLVACGYSPQSVEEQIPE